MSKQDCLETLPPIAIDEAAEPALRFAEYRHQPEAVTRHFLGTFHVVGGTETPDGVPYPGIFALLVSFRD